MLYCDPEKNMHRYVMTAWVPLIGRDVLAQPRMT